MSQLSHISKNKKNLQKRSQIIRQIREFFWSLGFSEVETPNIIKLPGQEPYLSPMKINVHDEKGMEHRAYLHTSPEYTMKKMLAAGFDKIFSISKCYRDYESFGGYHNPEFTMLEWYRANENFKKIMDDVELLFSSLAKKSDKMNEVNFAKKHMKDLWQEHVGVNLDDYLTREALYDLCVEKNLNPRQAEPFEDLFFRIFLNEIEPKLIEPTIVHHYPAQMAALAKLSDKDPRYAERFEVYINGIEIANCFTELTDRDEQEKRLQEEKELREILGRDLYDIDEEFIKAVDKMPPSAGIALGVDRLVQVLLDCQDIDDVLVLPSSKLFN